MYIRQTAMLVSCLLSLCGCASWDRQESRPAATVRFIYRNIQAKEVCIAGSFNQWAPGADCMAQAGGVWAKDIVLPKGRHEYVFVIDGYSWQPDPGAVLSEETGFGTKNSILIIE